MIEKKLFRVSYIDYAIKNSKELLSESKVIGNGSKNIWAETRKHAETKVKGQDVRGRRLIIGITPSPHKIKLIINKWKKK